MVDFQNIEPDDSSASLDGQSVHPDGEMSLQEQKVILEGLHDQGVEYLVIQGFGYQFFIKDANLSGEIVRVREEPGIDENGGETKITFITVKSDQTSRDFQISLGGNFGEGQGVTVEGAALVFVNRPLDIIEGSSEERTAARFMSLKKMLNDQLPAVAHRITTDGSEIYNDEHTREQFAELRSGNEDAQDGWNDLLAEFQQAA